MRDQLAILRARRAFRRGVQPFSRVLAIPVAFAVLRNVFGAEDRDRRTRFVDDEMAQPPRRIRAQRLAERAVQFEVDWSARGFGHGCKYSAIALISSLLRPRACARIAPWVIASTMTVRSRAAICWRGGTAPWA